MPTIYDGKLDRAARRCSEIMDILVDTLGRAPEIHRPRVIDIASDSDFSVLFRPIIMPYTTNTLSIPRVQRP